MIGGFDKRKSTDTAQGLSSHYEGRAVAEPGMRWSLEAEVEVQRAKDTLQVDVA